MDIMHPNRDPMTRIALEFLPFDQSFSGRVLELGVGTGYFAERSLTRFPHASLLAIDGSASMLEAAAHRLRASIDRVDLRQGDFRTLDQTLADERPFDLVMSSYALHHLEKSAKLDVIRACWRWLVPGGWLVNADVIIGATAALESRYQHLRNQGILDRAGTGHPKFTDLAATTRELRRMEEAEQDKPLPLLEDLVILSEAGFTNVAPIWVEYREAVLVGQHK